MLELPNVELAGGAGVVSEDEGSWVSGEVPACKLLMLRLTGTDSPAMASRVNMRKDFMIIIWKIFYGTCNIMIIITNCTSQKSMNI